MDNDISEMMRKFSDMMNNSKDANTSETSGFSTNGNIDINTILKIKSIIDKMNNSNDPRKNLLKSLKPYMRESRKSKIDQYINLFSMTKVMEAFKELGEKNKW